MKTLDEVIKGFECCNEINCAECPYANWDNTDVVHCNDTKKEDDALHYLKEHKNQQDFYSDGIKRTTEMIDKCEKTVAEYLAVNNPPLTWDELRTMEGKPVWIEDNIDEPENITKYWFVYYGIDKAKETEYALLSDFYYDKAQYGETWQAYRKERE